ncbi:microtubule-associated protein RP/EB family member 1 [Rhipicephalus sanguineus]|uniref:EB1 C-terminal domain-containing protein n=1 Tax=Rhipicephalus sanguineus TaxID=34632 RepID=A0A9D4PA59_RHISA|nr:microtubule-associated protein RP/EB family member 1 [Rhipicephalus sanguineus]KAH7931744.1 hypothetical protein HPB52_025438 [Rhipicephalus sanguineus]
MEDPAPTHPEECSGGAVSSGADSSPTGAACTAVGAACNLAENRTKASELLHWVNAYLGTSREPEQGEPEGQARTRVHPELEALREAFEQVGVDRELRVERLAEGSYRDNLELIQWFKDLFESQFPGPAAMPPEVRWVCTRGTTVSPGGGAGAGDFTDTVEELANQVVELKEALYWLELERNFYYSKLCEIEVLCWEHERDHGKECVSEKILDLMRGSDDEDWYGADEDAAQSGEHVAEATEQESH